MRRDSLQTRWHAICAGLALLGGCLLSASCPAAAAQTETPVYAQLLGRLDAGRLAGGSPLFLKTTAAWKQADCTLPPGSTLEGEVVRVQHRGPGVKHEQMDLRFHPISCAKDETQQWIPLLVAMQAPHHSDQPTNDLASSDLQTTFASMVASHSPMGGGSGHANDPDHIGALSTRELETSNLKGDPPLRIGEMRGFSKITVILPRVLTDPTTLVSPHPILIDRDTRIALILRPIHRSASSESASAPAATRPAGGGASPDATRTAAAPPPKPPRPPVQEDEPDTNLCVETGCAIAGNGDVKGATLERALPLRALGYRVRPNQVLHALRDDAAVAFLNDRQVLVTFNTHALVQRSEAEVDWALEPRMVRAVVISTSTDKILRQQEWLITGSGPYLWPLGKDRVLVHIGGTLRILGPGLALEHQWTPPGIVRLIRVSPSRDLIAAVVEHERHTLEEHRRLAAFLGPDREVEEDETLTLLDGSLKVLGSDPLRGDFDLPAILDSGIVLNESHTREKWKVQQLTWAHKTEPIVRVTSPCPLRVETLPTNLILLAGCAPDSTARWYKVVRADGRILLTGTTSNDNWVTSVCAPPDGKVFAVGVAQASRPVNFEAGMTAADFTSMTVSVYRTSDGKRLFDATSPGAAVNRHSFALSEDGSQLAVLSGDGISLYKTGMAARHPEARAKTASAGH